MNRPLRHAPRQAERSTIAAGTFADIVIFDPRTIEDRGTPETPDVHPLGIRDVIVNGEFMLRDGAMTAARPGRGLKR